MSIYRMKVVYPITFSLIFIASAVAGIDMFLNGETIGILAVLASIVMLYIFSNPKYYFKLTADRFIRHAFNKEESCRWEWIYSITTERNNITGGYFTVVHWTSLDKLHLAEYLTESNKCNENIGKLFITSHIANYRQLLKEIVNRSVNVSLDETTKKLVQ